MSDNPLLHPAVRWRPRTPRPRDVPVLAEEHHCTPNCEHLREAWRRGAEWGARAERERWEAMAPSTTRLLVVGAFLAGMFVPLVLRLVVVWWEGR